MSDYQSQPIRFSTYTNGTNGLTPEIKDGYWWIGNTNTNVKAEGLDGTDGVSFSGVVEYYYATLADNQDGYPTKTENSEQVVDLSRWYNTIEETKFGTKVTDGTNEGKTYKYLWNVEGVKSTDANGTLHTDYTNPELVQVYLGGRIPAEYISYYASSHDSTAPGLQPGVSTDGNSLTIENDSSWSTAAGAPDSNNYLFEITFVKYAEKDENGKNLYAKMSGPTIIGHSGADAMALELDNDSDVIAKTANGTILGTDGALSVVNASVVQNGVKVSDASVLIYSKPNSFVNNTNYTFANNTLTIKSLPTGFSSGKFVFTYNNLYATYNLSVALAENDYNLIIPKSVINSTDNGGDIEIKVEKISADGTSETITASNEVDITYSGSSNISKTGWKFTYPKGESTPLQLTLKDKTGSFVWDTETIEFVHNGSDGTGVTIQDSYDTEEEFYEADITGKPGDAYLVAGDLYVWTESGWNNVGRIQGPQGNSAYVHVKYSDNGTSFTSNNGETPGAYMGVYADNLEADSPNFSDYTWTKIAGDNAPTLETRYKNSTDIITESPQNPTASNGWNTTIESTDEGERTYMIQKYSNQSAWSIPVPISAIDGEPGKDGAEIKYIYLLSNEAIDESDWNNKSLGPSADGSFDYTTDLQNSWTDSPSGISETNKYEYMTFATKPAGTNTTFGDFSDSPVIWSKWGEKGQDAYNIKYMYLAYASETLPNNKKPSSSADATNKGWTDDPSGVTAEKPYEFVIKITVPPTDSGESETVSAPKLWNRLGQDFNIAASSYITKKDAVGNYSSVTLTAHPINLGTPVIKWYKDNSSTASATGNTYTVAAPGVYEAKVDGTDWKDSVEIKEVLDGTSGADAIAVVLSNSFITFNSSFDQSEQCKIEIYEGGEALTYNSSATSAAALQNGSFFRGSAAELGDNANSDIITIPAQSEPGGVEVGLTIKTKDGTVLTNRTANINWTVVDNGEPAVTRYFTLTPDFISRDASFPQNLTLKIYEQIGNNTPEPISETCSYVLTGPNSDYFFDIGGEATLAIYEDYFNSSTNFLQLRVYIGSQEPGEGEQGPVEIGAVSIPIREDAKRDYYLYHDQIPGGEKPALPTELNYGAFPDEKPNTEDSKMGYWYTEQSENSYYYCSKQGAYTSLEQATLPWHGPEYVNPQPITYNDMWGALNTAVKEEEQNETGLKVGVYPFTIEKEGGDTVKCLGINADLIKTGALCVGDTPFDESGEATNWSNNVLYAAMDTPEDGSIPLVRFAGWKAEPSVLSSADNNVQLRTDDLLKIEGYDAPVRICAHDEQQSGQYKRFVYKTYGDEDNARLFDVSLGTSDTSYKTFSIVATNEYQTSSFLVPEDNKIVKIVRYDQSFPEGLCVWEESSTAPRVYTNDDFLDWEKNQSPSSEPDLIYYFEPVSSGGTYILNDGTLVAERGRIGGMEIANIASKQDIVHSNKNLARDKYIFKNPYNDLTSLSRENYVYTFQPTEGQTGAFHHGIGICNNSLGNFFVVGKKYVFSYKFKILESTDDIKYISGHCGNFTIDKAIIDGIEQLQGHYNKPGYPIDGTLGMEHSVSLYITCAGTDSDTPGIYIQPQRNPEDDGSYYVKFSVWDLQVEEGEKQTPWSPPYDDLITADVNTNNFSWKFSPTEGMFMWSGPQPTNPTNTKTKDAIFAIYDNRADGATSPEYELSLRGHIDAESGTIGNWSINEGTLEYSKLGGDGMLGPNGRAVHEKNIHIGGDYMDYYTWTQWGTGSDAEVYIARVINGMVVSYQDELAGGMYGGFYGGRLRLFYNSWDSNKNYLQTILNPNPIKEVSIDGSSVYFYTGNRVSSDTQKRDYVQFGNSLESASNFSIKMVSYDTSGNKTEKTIKLEDLAFKGPYAIKYGSASGTQVGRIYQMGTLVYGMVKPHSSASTNATFYFCDETTGAQVSIPGPSASQTLNYVISGTKHTTIVISKTSDNKLSMKTGGQSYSPMGNMHGNWTYFCYSANTAQHPYDW